MYFKIQITNTKSKTRASLTTGSSYCINVPFISHQMSRDNVDIN